ncbi:hypothetical protein F4802DRAFT_583904 [Xylaria palmicola]|nr:hypothetical protein F4802DRAFT_583904 [Xylaria palmicola]
MSTPCTPTRRNSAATEMTLTDDTHSTTEKMASYTDKKEYVEDDDKTLSNFSMGEGSSSHSTTKLSKAMTQLKSKLKGKDEKPKPKTKTQVPPGYYPTNLQTFQALAESRM